MSLREDRMRTRATLLSLAVLPFLALPAAAEGWQDDVTRQLGQEKNCTVTFFSQVVERTVEGREVVIAKAHCEDKRAFDIYRDDARKPFRLAECGVVEKIEC
jgi:hypothetical protein